MPIFMGRELPCKWQLCTAYPNPSVGNQVIVTD